MGWFGLERRSVALVRDGVKMTQRARSVLAATLHSWFTEGDLSGVVLVAEDDELLRALVVDGLAQEGLLVCPAGDGQEALDLARTRRFDLYILDRNLPNIDGVSVLRMLRRAGDQTPALFMTTMGEVNQRVQGLDAGGDDYIVKPVAIPELLARVRALLRRPAGIAPESLRHGALRLDLTAKRVFVNDIEIELTAQDVTLLSVFLRHPHRAYTREALLDQMTVGKDNTPAAVEHAISRLRRKLDQAGAPDLIQTVRGIGYRLSPPAGEASTE